MALSFQAGQIIHGSDVEYAVPEANVDRSPSPAPYGSDGSVYGLSVVLNGVSQYLDLYELDDPEDLQGWNRWRTYGHMRREDPSVRSNLWLYKLPIKGAEWSVVPYSEDGIDQEIADAIRWNFGLDGQDGYLDLSWRNSIGQALLNLDFGTMFEEIIWDENAVPWVRPDGQEKLLLPITRLAPRYPATVSKIDLDPRRGGISALEQNLPNTKPIPGDRLAAYPLERGSGSFLSESMLRPMYAAYKLKRNAMVAHGIAYDRWAVGLPVTTYPQGGGPGAKREAERMGRNARSHERATVTHEGGNSGWGFRIETATVQEPIQMLRYYDQQMSLAALSFFKDLGTTDTGSRAVAEFQVEPFYLALDSVANDVAEERRRKVWRRFVDVNYGPEYEVPKLRVSRLMAKNLATLATILAQLTAAGFSFTDRDTQNDIRDELDLRGLPELPAGVGVEGGGIVAAPPGPGSALDPGMLVDRLRRAVDSGMMTSQQAQDVMGAHGVLPVG